MKRTILILLLVLLYGTSVARAQSSRTKCLYESRDLSFAFLYPENMQELSPLRPHIKKNVVDTVTGFGVAVSVLEFDSEYEIKAMQQEWMTKSEDELKEFLQQISNSIEYGASNIKVLSVQKGYVIDRLPVLLITQTMDGAILDMSGRAMQWTFMLCYKNKVIQLCGMAPMGMGADLTSARSLFMSIAASFAIISQYEGADSRKQALDSVWGISLESSRAQVLQQIRKKGFQAYEYNKDPSIQQVFTPKATFAGYADCKISFCMNEAGGPIGFVSIMFPPVARMGETKPLTDFCKRMIENKYNAVYTRLADYEEAGIVRPPEHLYPYIIGRYTLSNGDYVEIYIEDQDLTN
ncbi:MAG: hypothetical protein K2G93_08205, partial [Rikenella sp.]|nr:hypothetical protein [Rikenella sp.]